VRRDNVVQEVGLVATVRPLKRIAAYETRGVAFHPASGHFLESFEHQPSACRIGRAFSSLGRPRKACVCGDHFNAGHSLNGFGSREVESRPNQSPVGLLVQARQLASEDQCDQQDGDA
jgi:hypothetical protein